MLTAEQERNRIFAHPGTDWPTLGLLLAMWAGLGANLWWALSRTSMGLGAGVLHLILGVACLNLSFTIWHEAVHGTVSRSSWVNTATGILGGFPALIPYFFIRRDHLLHHEFANDPKRDPDWWFAAKSIWSLPLRYPAGVREAKRIVTDSKPPAWEAWADRAILLVALGAMIALVAGGHAWALLWAWILPKGVAMWIHAWYVNVLPHRELPAERYRDTRIFPIGWLNPLMLCHNYHGVHHAWPTIPWHRYPAAFRAQREVLEKRGAPIRLRLNER